MSKDFQYDLKEYIEKYTRLLIDNSNFKLHPGNWAPEPVYTDCPPFDFGIYMTIPNSLYLMPYVKTDNMRVTLYSKSYDTASLMQHSLLDELNIHTNNFMTMEPGGLVAHLLAQYDGDPPWKIHEVSARSLSIEQKEFIEGTVYFEFVLDIMAQYVEL